MTTPAVRFGYAVVVAFFACLAIALAGVLYTNHVQSQAQRRADAERSDSDHRWCKLLGDLDGAYRREPPKTDTGRSVAAELHLLRTAPPPIGFGCPPS